MDLFKRIQDLSNIYDDDGPSAMVPESRPMFNDGGMLVQPSDDGSRPGYAKPIDNPLTKNQKQKVIKAFPDIKFDFDTYPKYGVKKYLTGDDRKTNKDYTKVDRFTKKGFTLEQGKGLSTRGKVYQDRGKRLSVKDQEKIKSLFELPSGEEWDFKTHKYGIKQAGRENLLVRMARVVKEKKPWKIAADVGSPKGWMLLQMNRVYENEKKAKVKNPTYKPFYKKINGVNRIIGFKDNTSAGQGKTYYGLDKYSKKNATDWAQHGDYKQNVKLFDIAKRSNNAPNEVITGLLNDKGFKGKVTLNNLVNFLSGVEATSPAAIKNAIVRHHNSGVAFGSATNDLSLTTQIINKKIVEAEQRIRSGNVLPEDVQLLKNNNIYVRGNDGKLYGSGKKSAIGQFKQIESDVASAVESGKDFKGNKIDFKKLMAFCPAGTAKVTKAGGGRVPYADGPVCTPDEAIRGMNEEFDKLKKGNATTGEASRTVNKFKNLGVKGMSGLLKAGLVSEVAFEAAVGFDRVISEGQSPMQAFRQSYLTAPLRAIGAMKSFEEGEREEILDAARDKGKVGRVLDLQNLVGDKNKLASNIQGLKSNVEDLQRLDDGDFGYMGGTQGQEDALASAQANLQDMYRSGELSKAEQLFSTKPQDLKLKDKTLMDAYNDAIEKRRNIQAERSSIAQSIAADKNRVRDANKAMLEKFPIYTPEIIDSMYERAKVEKPKNLDYADFGKQMSDYDKMNYFADNFRTEKAGGGIAGLSGGDPKGAMTTSMNPDSQGLQGLFNRVKKV